MEFQGKHGIEPVAWVSLATCSQIHSKNEEQKTEHKELEILRFGQKKKYM